MSNDDGKVFGFNRIDKDLILDGLGGAGGQGRGRGTDQQPRGFRPKYGMTKTGGLPANGTGLVYVQRPTASGWENGYEAMAWNRGAALDGDLLLLLIEIDGRICVHEVCLDG